MAKLSKEERKKYYERQKALRAKRNEEKWIKHYNELKAYVAENHQFPNKHKRGFVYLLNWVKYTRKKIKAGTLTEERKVLFEELEASRSVYIRGNKRE